jgi:hypothetical protein
MNEEKAREILRKVVKYNNDLFLKDDHIGGKIIDWLSHETTVTMEGEFRPDELEAIAWWMRNKGV